MKETLRHMRKYLNTYHSMRLPLFLGIPLFKDRLDFADAHTDLSPCALTPLKYLIMINYRNMYLYIYRLAEYADRQSSREKINRSRDFIGVSFIMLITPNN